MESNDVKVNARRGRPRKVAADNAPRIGTGNGTAAPTGTGTPTPNGTGTGVKPAAGVVGGLADSKDSGTGIGTAKTSEATKVNSAGASAAPTPTGQGPRPNPGPEAQAVADSPVIQIEESPEDEKARKAREATRKWRAKQSKPPEPEPDDTASLLLGVLDSLAFGAVGPAGVLTKDERELINPPLTRILARMDERTAAVVQTISDPLALVIGLGAWGSRLIALRREMIEIKKGEAAAAAFQPTPNAAPPATPRPPVTVRSNGALHYASDGTPIAPPAPEISNWIGGDL